MKGLFYCWTESTDTHTVPACVFSLSLVKTHLLFQLEIMTPRYLLKTCFINDVKSTSASVCMYLKGFDIVRLMYAFIHGSLQKPNINIQLMYCCMFGKCRKMLIVVNSNVHVLIKSWEKVSQEESRKEKVCVLIVDKEEKS